MRGAANSAAAPDDLARSQAYTEKDFAAAPFRNWRELAAEKRTIAHAAARLAGPIRMSLVEAQNAEATAAVCASASVTTTPNASGANAIVARPIAARRRAHAAVCVTRKGAANGGTHARNQIMKRTRSIVAATASLLLLGAAGVSAPAFAADPGNAPAATPASPPANAASATDTHHKREAQQLINEATAEVKKMSADPKLKQLMAKAKGIYLVPEFGRGALIVGGRGGAGVVLAKKNGKWSDPAFYDFGAISIGAQAGGSGGEVAFLLMTDNAVDAFKSGNKIALNAEAGISIVDYSASAQGSWGKGDIVMWSDTAGLYGGGSISLSDLNWADNNNQAYYGRKVAPDQIFAGQVNTPDATQLKDALRG